MHDLYGAIEIVQRTLFEGIHVSVQIVPVFRDAPQILHDGPVTLQIIGRLEFPTERVAVAGFTSWHQQVSSEWILVSAPKAGLALAIRVSIFQLRQAKPRRGGAPWRSALSL
ncbi:MAG TPA: hypothetical protein DF282_17700 [Hyphomonas sp.]|nr:hypothetical protein [Hyphomonas sp.]